MKKKRRVIVAAAAALIVLIAGGLWIFRHDVSPREFEFDQLDRAPGGQRLDLEPAHTLNYGWSGGPPTMTGESFTSEEPHTQEIIALLEGHRYRETRASDPAQGGVMFMRCEGCMMDPTAYWDGNLLWAPGSHGWLPYVPSAGFGAEVEQLLNTD